MDSVVAFLQGVNWFQFFLWIGIISLAIAVSIASYKLLRFVLELLWEYRRYLLWIGLVLIVAAIAWMIVQHGIGMIESKEARHCFDAGVQTWSCEPVSTGIVVIVLGFFTLVTPFLLIRRFFSDEHEDNKRRHRDTPKVITGVREVPLTGPRSLNHRNGD